MDAIDESAWSPVSQAAGRILEDLDRHAVEVSDRLRQQIPAYGRTAVADLVAGVAVSITSGMHALLERRGPTEEELDQVSWVAEARARQGIPLAAVLQAYHLGAREIWLLTCADARRAGGAESVLLEGANLLWRWTDTVTVHAASAHQQAGMEIVRHDQQRRTEFLRALLFGGASPGEVAAEAPAYRLSAERMYLPFQAEPGPGAQLAELERRITASGGLPDQPALVGLIEGSLAGVLAKVPDLGEHPATLVVGPATELSRVPASYLLACRGLQAAVGFQMPGVHRVEDLALLVAVCSEDFVGSHLVRRYLDPLRALRGSAADVEQTLWDYLRAGLRVDEAARAGFVHPNTVRHRLGRFEDVTGADLHRPEDLVGVWWALQRRRLGAVAPSPTRAP